MGCSPSKGQLCTGVYNHSQKDLQLESNSDVLSNRTEVQSRTETGEVLTGPAVSEEESSAAPLQGKISAPSDVLRETTTTVDESVDVPETNSQEELLTEETTDMSDENGSKTTRTKKRQRKSVGFLKTAAIDQQTAYKHLKPNSPKYESLLGLLDKATQTQLSIQPLVDLLVLQYEEIIQTLEEMTTQGEQLLDLRKHMEDCPTAQEDRQIDPDIQDDDAPPDLPQMLQHFIDKMRQVGDSLKGLGDAAIEEAAEYFGSVSQLLGEKLVAKRTAEERLNQVLASVEAASLRKSSPEDSSLHSEDSGIGADNDCQIGSARVRVHRKSSGFGAKPGSSNGRPKNPEDSPDQLREVKGDKNDEDFADDDRADNTPDVKEEVQDEVEINSHLEAKKMSIQSQEELKTQLQVSLQNNWPDSITVDRTFYQKDRNIRRPQTANNPPVPCPGKPRYPGLRGTWRSQSADCLYSKIEYMVQRQDRRQSIKKNKTAQSPQYGNRVTVKPNLVPRLPPVFVPEPPGKNAVKRLICTFSQGVQDTSNHKPSNRPARFRSRRSFLPALTNYRASVSTTDHNSYPPEKELSVKPEELDTDSLPPPPPEVLMDSSFNSNDDCNPRQDRGRIQGLRASLQTVPLLPSQDNNSEGSLTATFADVVKDHQESDLQFLGGSDKQEADRLLQHSHKFSPGDQSSYTTPPASRARIPPSSYSVRHKDPSLPTLSSSCPVQWEAFTAPPSSCVQRWTRRSSEDENGFLLNSTSSSFGSAQTQLKTQSTSQALTPSCRSTLPRPWGEVSRARLQSSCSGQTFTGSCFSAYRPASNKQRPSLSSVSEPHNEGSDENTSANERRDLEQDVPVSCAVFAAQKVEPEIKDERLSGLIPENKRHFVVT